MIIVITIMYRMPGSVDRDPETHPSHMAQVSRPGRGGECHRPPGGADHGRVPRGGGRQGQDRPANGGGTGLGTSTVWMPTLGFTVNPNAATLECVDNPIAVT
jgi:hypothetical protein